MNLSQGFWLYLCSSASVCGAIIAASWCYALFPEFLLVEILLPIVYAIGVGRAVSYQLRQNEKQ